MSSIAVVHDAQQDLAAPAPLATTIAAPDQAALAEHAAAIRTLGKQRIENAIEIGRRLTECRVILKKTGRWQSWLEDEFGWSDQQARRFIHVFERRFELNKLLTASLPVSPLYLLAAPSAPEAAMVEIAQRAETGETVDVAAVKSAVAAQEPAAGRGAIVNVLRAHGHEVIASDIADYGEKTHFANRDFLAETKLPAGVCGDAAAPRLHGERAALRNPRRSRTRTRARV